MGHHSKPSRVRLPHGATIAAAPTLAGVAAACLLSQQAPALAAAGPAAEHTAVLPAAFQRGPSAAQLLSAARQAAPRKRAAAAAPASYTVRPGDSLSAIAGRVYHDAAAWPVLYWANKTHVRWADVIEAGQVLAVPAKPARIPDAPAQLAPPVPAAQTAADYQPRHAVPAPAQADPTPAQADPAPAPVQAAAASYSGAPGSFQACVISRESGGDPTAVNPSSGAGGLYGFLPSTWASLGYSGLPENAPVAEQNAAFEKLYAEDGTSPWGAYDGC